jgi:ribosomal protein S18 acetylase RimI-like enzyme
MPQLQCVFTNVTEKNVEQLRLLNTTIFPVRYNDDFYKKVYKHPKLAQFALYNDTPIGAVAGRIEEDKESGLNTQLYIMTLGVLEPYRRCGVGDQLLKYITETVKTDSEFQDLLTVVLHVQTSNTAALAFYARHGFVTTGKIENYYQKLQPPDCHILTLAIDRSELEPEPEPEATAAAAAAARASRVDSLQQDSTAAVDDGELKAGQTNGYGVVAVDLAAEAAKAKETMKALRASQMNKPPPKAMKLNKATGQMEEFHSEKLQDDLGEEAVEGGVDISEMGVGDDY